MFDLNKVIRSFFANKAALDVNVFAGTRSTNASVETSLDEYAKPGVQVACSAITISTVGMAQDYIYVSINGDSESGEVPFPIGKDMIVTIPGLNNTQDLSFLDQNGNAGIIALLIHQ